MNDTNGPYALWLSNVPQMSGAKIKKMREAVKAACPDERLIEEGGRLSAAKVLYGWGEAEWNRYLPGLPKEVKEAVLQSKKEWDLQKEWEILAEEGVSFVSPEDPAYPSRLRSIANPPYGLYVKGHLPKEDKRAVAVVGARQRSEYGRMAAQKIAEALGRCGLSVISGLARGIDADGHKGALSGGGATYAVMGCGVDVCYPSSHRYLYEKILSQGGGIISEYPLHTPPLARQFPQRNRIISGLCDAVIVVEAKVKSGSLITADYAMEQGRDVYAVPGRLGDPLSEGCNRLISQGAGIFINEEELLADLSLDFSIHFDRSAALEARSAQEDLLYPLLDFTPVGIGTLLQKSGLTLQQLLLTLDGLQEKGYIKESVPNYYVRCL